MIQHLSVVRSLHFYNIKSRWELLNTITVHVLSGLLSLVAGDLTYGFSALCKNTTFKCIMQPQMALFCCTKGSFLRINSKCSVNTACYGRFLVLLGQEA